MASFSQQKFPHRAAGAQIPEGVRRALLSWLNDHDVDHREVWKRLRQRIGYGEPQDVVDDVIDRFGPEEATPVFDAITEEAMVRRATTTTDPNRYAVPILTTVPAPLFLDALEIAVEVAATRYRMIDTDVIETYDYAAIEEINRLFEVRGINYRFTPDGKAEWHGDEQAYQQVLAPALAALDDPRLGAAAQEFADALRNLRIGSREGMKNAIRDASNAVEATMKAILDDHGVPRVGNETADPLWGLLSDSGLVAAKTKDVICAAPRFRNSYGGHGPDPEPTPVPNGIADYAVREAASAIVYLASLLRP